jgi:hypothetical protein
MNENILKIPYSAVNNNWNLLQQFLKMKGNPRYVIVGDIDLIRSKDIPNLGNLVGVEGDLDLTRSSIQTLGNLEFVSGDLDLRFSSIESLGELEFVDDSLSLWSCKNIKTLGNLNRVDGNLNLDYSSIESLGNLEFVGGNLRISGTNIPPDEINKLHVDGRIFR